MFDTISNVAFWITATRDGGMAMGDAPNEEEARLMIESQQRGSVTLNERSGRYRWTVVLDSGKSSHGWADTERDAWWFVKEALNRAHRGTTYRRPRGLWSRPE
jgi:hypothetical protein